jgi:hypothetical protein
LVKEASVMTAARWVVLGIGAVLGIIGLALMAVGGGALFGQALQRDTAGYYMSPEVRIAADGHAVTAEGLDLFVDQPADWMPAVDVTGRVSVASDREAPVFVGVALQRDVDRYLAGVAHSEIASIDGRSAVAYRTHDGSVRPAAPAEQDFWVASSQGTGTQTLEWDARTGRWAVVAMNADASAGVDAVAAVGATSALLTPIATGLMVAGLLFALLGTGLVVAAVARSTPDTTPTAPVPVAAGAYPARLEARLDDHLSRWQWVFKWLLALPHYVVLALMWMAFAMLTVVAWFAILFTGRYPRTIFEFNVGVLRWTWRVAYYSYGALGTDRYPPFTLAETDHPATFDVAYPEQLSRGLALVKWWLLAIPHYLIVAVFTGSVLSWTFTTTDPDGARVALGGGLLGVLVLIAGVALAVTARYPAGLFDVIMGINRWVYRVIAYVALLTDEYPPFRLDMGGGEPTPPRPLAPDAGPDADAAAPPLVSHGG